MVWCGMVGMVLVEHAWSHMIYRTPFVDYTMRLIQHNWVVLAYNFNLLILVLIIGKSSIGAFLLTILLLFYPCYYIALSFYSCTC
jgi:hypothetical protein